MRKIPATRFKAQCLDLMDRVAERRESYVITKRGKPVARLVPMPRIENDSIFGCLRSKAFIRGDIVDPVLPQESWETLEEWDELTGDEKPLPTGASRGGQRKRNRR